MQAYQRPYNIALLRLCPSFLTGLAGCFVISFATPAKAFQYEDVPKLELDAGMAQSKFKEQTQGVEGTPLDDKALAYRIRLPADWEKAGGRPGRASGGNIAFGDQLQLSSGLISTVAHYRGPGSLEGRSFFKMKARKLEHIITARKWFMHFILNEGYNLEAIREISPKRVAARYTIFRGDTSYTVMAVAAVNGDQLVLGEYYVPTSRMNETMRDRQTLSMRSFELVNELDKPGEPVKTYQFIDIARIDYPASWLIRKPNVRNIDEMNLTLYNTKKGELRQFSNYVSRDNFNGRIRVKLITRKKAGSIEAQLKKIRKTFRQRDLKTNQLIRDVEDIDYNKDFDLARTQAYTVSDNNGGYLDYQLWVAVMRSQNYYVFATLFTPDRDNEYYNWSVNSEAFKFILSRIDIK